MQKNKYLIIFARKFWSWYWFKLMDGFAPSDIYGNYKRPQGIKENRKLKFKPQKNENLYLLIGSTCPWCHRTLLIYKLKDLSKTIKIIFLKPRFEDGEWIFKEHFFGIKTLSEVYSKFNLNINSRPTLPILISIENKIIKPISNESNEIVRILNKIDDYDIKTNKNSIICPTNQLLDLIHYSINDGVYKCGFARNQKAYKEASKNLFSSLYKIDCLLKENGGPWLLGEVLSIADIYLFPTLIRWELIYSILFKCTQHDISEFENIMRWRFNFFNFKEVRETCFEKEWMQDYYRALFPLNPNNIVPLKNSLEKIIQYK